VFKKKVTRLFSGIVGREQPVPIETAAVLPATIVAPAFVSTEGLLEGIEKTRKQEAAKYQRDRRQKLADQKKAIKEKLRVPVAQLLAEAEAQAKRIHAERSIDSLNRGMYLTDAPAGKGLLVSGGYNSEKIGVIGGALAKAESLGQQTVEDCNYWPVNDRRHITPEGTATDTEDSASGYLTDGTTPKAKKCFQVKLNDFDLDRIVRDLVTTYCVKTNEDAYVCRLCSVFLDSFTGARGHFENVHGDESNPAHDDRFGNCIKAYVSAENREHEQWEKRAKRATAV
jgi:hypothetical protein